MAQDLADLYVRLGITKPDIIFSLRRVLDQRKDDLAFLTVYCRASQEAHNFDDAAQKAARWLLELDPTSIDAHVILGSTLLQTGAIKDSMKHAEAVLQERPNDSVGLRLLGACYAAEKRLDETAMRIFEQALVSNPEANDILLAVSHGYIQMGREDADAERIYRKALEASPDDEPLLQFLAELANKRSDDDLTIQTVERLLKLGQHSKKLALQLADAYCRKNVTEDKAEPVYREALLFQPDHATVASNLATIYVRQKRTDNEAMALYESVYERDQNRRDVARQLALSYHAAELSDRMLTLAQKLLAEDPDDHEMKKLQAHAAVALDQMDSAIQDYEQILEQRPDDAETTCRLASLYGKKRRADNKALKIYQRAARAQPENF